MAMKLIEQEEKYVNEHEKYIYDESLKDLEQRGFRLMPNKYCKR